MRPNWDEYFMAIAKLVSARSTCNSRPVGAVMVKDKHILATGYNGSIPGAPHCTDGEESDYCFRRAIGVLGEKQSLCRIVHAEANAIAQAARFGISLEGASLYVTLSPCYTCLKLLAVVQVKCVFYEYKYESSDSQRDEFWRQSVKDSGIEVFEQLCVSEETLKTLRAALECSTSRRRLLSGS